MNDLCDHSDSTRVEIVPPIIAVLSRRSGIMKKRRERKRRVRTTGRGEKASGAAETDELNGNPAAKAKRI